MTRKDSFDTIATTEEARDMKETHRSHDGKATRCLSSTSRVPRDDDDERDKSHDLHSSKIHSDRLLSLGRYDRVFIRNVMTKLQLLGNTDTADLTSMCMILHNVCAWERPFDVIVSRDELNHRRTQRPVLNIDQLWASIEHTLSRCESAKRDVMDRPLTMAAMKNSVCDVLKEMNIKVVRDDTRSKRYQKEYGTTDSPPFMDSWDSLSYCHCSLF